MEIIQSIALDFAQNATQATVFAKQYDKDTRKIEITPLNNGSPYTIDTDVTARLQMTKNDGTTVINNAEISSGKITVVLTAQALTAAGTAVAEIGLYKGSTLLSSQTFYIDVQKGAYDKDAPESSDEYNALVEALGEAEQATATAEAASERAEAAVDSANTAIETARTVATGKMSLIPIDPTAEEIEAMPSGQLYGDTVNHKGVIKGGQEFYDSTYVDENLQRKTYFGHDRPQCLGYETRLKYEIGDRYYCESDKRTYVLNRIIEGPVPPMYFYEWGADTPNVTEIVYSVIPQNYYTKSLELCEYVPGDIVFEYSLLTRAIIRCYVLQSLSYRTAVYQFDITFTYHWQEIAVPGNYYTKGEIDTGLNKKENTSNKVTSLSAQSTDTQYPSAKCVYDMIGDIESLLAEV